MYVDDISRHDGATWAIAYDKRDNVYNPYGERIFGSGLVGSAYCHFTHTGVLSRRAGQGRVIMDTASLIYEEWNLYPGQHWLLIGGTGYDISRIDDGSRVTGRYHARLMREIGN